MQSSGPDGSKTKSSETSGPLPELAGRADNVKPCSNPRASFTYHSVSAPRRYSTRFPVLAIRADSGRWSSIRG